MRIRRIFLIMICSWTILFPLVLSDCMQSYVVFLEMLFYCLSLYFMNKLLQDAISCLRCCSILIHITRTVTSILLISDLCYPGPGLWESWPHSYSSTKWRAPRKAASFVSYLRNLPKQTKPDGLRLSEDCLVETSYQDSPTLHRNQASERVQSQINLLENKLDL